MNVIEAMKQAHQILMNIATHSVCCDARHEAEKAILSLEDAIEQMENAEPVAWRITNGEDDHHYRTDEPDPVDITWATRYGRKYEPLYTHPAPAIPAGWQPIETAPEDGTFILVWNSNGINEVYWNELEGFWHHDVDFDCTFPLRGDFPTLWMPLPQPPKE